MFHKLTTHSLRKGLLHLASSCTLAFMLPACGGSGGGGGAYSGTLTEEDKIQAELSPNNHDIPDEIVPTTFQGQKLEKVVFDLQGVSYAGTGAPKLHFVLLQGGEVSEAIVTDSDGNKTTLSSAVWTGQSLGTGTEAISQLGIDGTGDESFTFFASDINISTKTISGTQTRYTATIGAGSCSLDGKLIISFASNPTECTFTYYITASSSQ